MAVTRRRLLAMSLVCGALFACAHQPPPSVAQLIDSGKDGRALQVVRESKTPPAADPGWTLALAQAAHAGNADLLGALIDRGADVNQRTGPLQVTPLHLALHPSTTTIYVDAARLLLDRGADPNSADTQGDTPLHYLASRKVFNIQAAKAAGIRLLLERGADATATDATGWTPLYFSAAAGDSDALLQLWLDDGAKVAIVDKSGVTPLDAAVTNDHESVARFLIQNGARPGILVAAPDWPADSTGVHRQFLVSGKSFALFGDWNRERGDSPAADAAYKTAETQLGLAVTEFQRVTEVYRSEATKAERPTPQQTAGALASTAVGVTLLALTGFGWVSVPRLNEETAAWINALADGVEIERAATRRLLDEVQAKRAALPGP